MPANGKFDVLPTLPMRISDVVEPWATRLPDQLALVEATGSWSYKQLAAVIADTRAWLIQEAVRPGDRVMLVCENCRAFVAILLALASFDAWPVLVSARLSAREVDQIREHCGARLIIYTTAISAQAREHAKRHGAKLQNVTGLGSIAVASLNELVEPEPISINITNSVAALIYTSGTTGLPKGVMLTHQGLLFVAAVSAKIRTLTPEDRLYGVLPMSHAVGLSVVLLGALLSGSTVYLTPRFDPSAAIASLENDRLTVLLGAPSMFTLLLEYAKLKGIASLNFPTLRIISSSGAPLHQTLKFAVENMFGLVLHNGYGVTECSPNIAQTRVMTPRSDVSVGRVFPGTEIKLVGPHGQPVEEGEVGELWVRGPNVMKGYYRAPEETAAAIDADGWFNTRDLAQFEDGNLFIVGRSKELIVRFGFNVYPTEVESVLNTCPGVARSAVIGRAVEGNEEVIAYVQPSTGAQLDANDLAAYARQHLTPYKQPSQIILVTSMPTTPTGKIMKDQLAKQITQSVAAG
jgi:long-chain acyl-CoA synthetase